MHIFIEEKNFGKCPKCGHSILAHTVCGNCGYYKNREIINVLEKLTKKEKKQRKKEMANTEKGQKGKPLTAEELSKK